MAGATEHTERILDLIVEMLTAMNPTAETPYDYEAALFAFDKAMREDNEASDDVLPDVLLSTRFDLNVAEVFALWLTVAPHLEPSINELIVRANNNVLRSWVDLSLCLRAFCKSRLEKAHLQSLFMSPSKLVDSGLISLVPRDQYPYNRLYHELVPGEQLLPLFVGKRTLSPSAAPYASRVEPSINMSKLGIVRDRHVMNLLMTFFERPSPRRCATHADGGLAYPAGVVLILHGLPGSGQVVAFKAMLGELERALLLVDGRALARASREQATQALHALCLEAELFGEPICIDNAADVVKPDSPLANILGQAVRRHQVVVALCLSSEEDLDASVDDVVVARSPLHVSSAPNDIEKLWTLHCSDELTVNDDIDFEALSHRIKLSALQIRKASMLSYYLSDLDEDSSDDAPRALLELSQLESAAKAQVSKNIGSLAVVSEPELKLDELVLEPAIQDTIHELISAARNRRFVLEDWGVGRKIRRGTGIVALFDGEPGTGKTHSAEAIAGELGLSIVRVNISTIIDKYIGETEKNLTRIFAEVRPDISLLLFDEADSLFSKRTSNVSQSTDRYSNMNVNVLLQLIERYEGLTVLTTNLKQAIDPAFERRFTYKLHFRLPEPSERQRIWEYLIPPQLARDLDVEELSEIELSGGEIKNAILLGCYHARHLGQFPRTHHFIEAARRESAATGRVVRYDNED